MGVYIYTSALFLPSSPETSFTLLPPPKAKRI